MKKISLAALLFGATFFTACAGTHTPDVAAMPDQAPVVAAPAMSTETFNCTDGTIVADENLCPIIIDEISGEEVLGVAAVTQVSLL
ncbi:MULTISPECIES: hypothetical protein [Hallerella]|uniref:hypothetical protein n=1 Tax=Hallerella TaxID=2815788 RepID=UPI0023F19F48|nr:MULTISPECIES: hypothetical protein [Hallerella]MBS7391625.1 hypothetical protein [Fibrobacter sp.]MCI6873112.1 hypothetical protein [Hallerella sp.]MDD6091548.1 hypothetical protein [Hallerella succinigenes]MDY5029847.1 hypothetical protein [Hallerella succinigenes]